MKSKSNADYAKELFERTGIKGKLLFSSISAPHISCIKPFDDYQATEVEIKEVREQIEKNGFWEQNDEWRISTVMFSKIEPTIRDGEEFFITTVKCETEIMIPAKTIERAIIFKKIYEDIIIELWHDLGWPSWTKKNVL